MLVIFEAGSFQSLVVLDVITLKCPSCGSLDDPPTQAFCVDLTICVTCFDNSCAVNKPVVVVSNLQLDMEL